MFLGDTATIFYSAAMLSKSLVCLGQMLGLDFTVKVASDQLFSQWTLGKGLKGVVKRKGEPRSTAIDPVCEAVTCLISVAHFEKLGPMCSFRHWEARFTVLFSRSPNHSLKKFSFPQITRDQESPWYVLFRH